MTFFYLRDLLYYSRTGERNTRQVHAWKYYNVRARQYVRNIKKYLLAALYNAPTTINSYYSISVPTTPT